MSDTIIQVDNLGKLYYVGGRKLTGQNLRIRARQAFVASRNYLGNIRRTGLRMYAHNFLSWTRKDKGNPTSETPLWDAPHGAFWVLRNISFEVKRGEVLGIIGRNGAGKSTLLKILSRITQPTVGEAVIHGRVGSLLEVGTGFHDELSGRENIYLNGTILGMKHTEITRKLDEIIAFSGVERFIDTPVKYYSSGMRVRLASPGTFFCFVLSIQFCGKNTETTRSIYRMY